MYPSPLKYGFDRDQAATRQQFCSCLSQSVHQFTWSRDRAIAPSNLAPLTDRDQHDELLSAEEEAVSAAARI